MAASRSATPYSSLLWRAVFSVRHRSLIALIASRAARSLTPFVNELRSMKVTPYGAQNTSGRSSAIDGRTTRHAGYAFSQRIHKRIEEAFGWIKIVAGLEQTKFRGCDRVGWAFSFATTAYI